MPSVEGPSTRDPLDGLVTNLQESKLRLLELSETLRAVERRTRAWDVTEPFLARRGKALMAEARGRYVRELGRVHELLAEHVEEIDDAGQVPGRRPVLQMLRRELRVLQQSFDPSNPLLRAVVEQLGAAVTP